jgi:hypothetical protein
MDEDSLYYEFDIKNIDHEGEQSMLLVISNVTQIVRCQQKMSD